MMDLIMHSMYRNPRDHSPFDIFIYVQTLFFSFYRLIFLAEFTKTDLCFDIFRGHISNENQELPALSDIIKFYPT